MSRERTSTTIGVECSELTVNSTELVISVDSKLYASYINNVSVLCTGMMEKITFNGLHKATPYRVHILWSSTFTECLITDLSFETEGTISYYSN